MLDSQTSLNRLAAIPITLPSFSCFYFCHTDRETNDGKSEQEIQRTGSRHTDTDAGLSGYAVSWDLTNTAALSLSLNNRCRVQAHSSGLAAWSSCLLVVVKLPPTQTFKQPTKQIGANTETR